MQTNKTGSLTLDALTAAAIIGMVIVLTSGLVFAAYKSSAETARLFQGMQIVESHLEELKGKACWGELDGQINQLSENITCSYQYTSETVWQTERLDVNVTLRGLKFPVVLERAVGER